MQKVETSWRKDGDWKGRYSSLYSARRVSLPKEEPHRISFLTDSSPYNILNRITSDCESSPSASITFSSRMISLLSQQSDLYNSIRGSVQNQSRDLGGQETLLLNMVRARKVQDVEAQDKTLDLKDDLTDDQRNEGCIHGISMRTTDRSISRSRFSRVSTRRDMDIPSILAFTANTTQPVQLKMPVGQQSNILKREELLRWSIRKAICPVCSQKWRDRSSITSIKYSGLKRNTANEIPTIIAPARLRSSINMAYVPRPNLALVDEEKSISGMRNTSATWQLTRARKLRLPKLKIPSPEASAPPKATAPLARKDLDARVAKFLRT
uniref:Uncharacterized protein n=1 Tax=Bombyx mori TaxID=7091 RepID=A0A8R2DN11_BOMMO|nr:uncharacterized protein LOC110386164 isoform X1 [Bombyx mori]